jgi:uncharacterized Zn-finger protein
VKRKFLSLFITEFILVEECKHQLGQAIYYEMSDGKIKDQSFDTGKRVKSKSSKVFKNVDKKSNNKNQQLVIGNNKKVPKRFPCDTCGKTFARNSYLKIHKMIHTNERPRVCPICDKAFLQYTSYNIHMRYHNDDRRYSCSICDMRFISSSHLKRHKTVHSNSRPVTCEICYTHFKTKDDLKKHTDVLHSEREKLACDICNKKLSDIQRLTEHISRLHSQSEKRWACSVCDKTFFSNRELRSHMIVHTGDRDHQCFKCEKSFSLKSNLNRHEKIHYSKANNKTE